MSILFGALTEADVSEILDDPDALDDAGRAFGRAAAAAAQEGDAAHTAWRSLPEAINTVHVTAALAPLTDAAQRLLDGLGSAGKSYGSVLGGLAEELRELKAQRQQLVGDINGFHASAPGKIAAQAAKKAKGLDLLGSAETLIVNWREVPAVVEQEAALRVRVTAFNLRLEAALAEAQLRLAGIHAGEKGSVRLPSLNSAAETERLAASGVPVGVAVAITGKVTASMLAELPAEAKLLWLETHSAAEINAAVKKDPSLAQEFWNAPPGATDVAAWWAGLSDSEKDALIAGAGGAIIGNLGGVPYSARGAANKNQLVADYASAQADEARLKKELKGVPEYLESGAGLIPNPRYDELKSKYDKAKARCGELDDISLSFAGVKAKDLAKSEAGDTAKSGGRSLIDFNFGVEPPLAAVAVGDMDTAQKVTYAVPGMGTVITGSGKAAQGWATAAQNVYTQESQPAVDGGSSHAVVAWIGYHAPGTGGELLTARADAGAPRLANELDALQETRTAAGDPVSAQVLAHSYGTTLVSNALTKTTHAVSSVVLVGSAGLETQPSTWNVQSSGGGIPVYATHAAADHLASVGYDTGIGHKVDPGDPTAPTAYGAKGEPLPPETTRGGTPAPGVTIFSSAGDNSQHLAATTGHEAIGYGKGASYFPGGSVIGMQAASNGHGYLDKGTESLYNAAAALTGHPDKIVGPQSIVTAAAQGAAG